MTERITITLPAELADRVRREARRRHKSQSEFVRQSLERELLPITDGKRVLPFQHLEPDEGYPPADGFTAENTDEYLAKHWAGDIERTRDAHAAGAGVEGKRARRRR